MSSNMKTVLLGDLLLFKNGKSLSVNCRNENFSNPVYGANGVIDYSNKKNAPKRVLIIGRVGSYCGSVHFSNEDCWVTDNSIIAQSRDVDEAYFYFVLLDSLKLNTYRVGSGQPLLNQNILRQINVKIPNNKLIRVTIGYFFEVIDKKIELNNQINETLEAMAQALFKSWFIDFEPVKAKIEAKDTGQDAEGILLAAMSAISGKEIKALKVLQATAPEEYAGLKVIAEQFPDSLEESELGMIPKGWEVKKIEEIVERISAGKRYSQKNVADKGKVPVLDQGRSGLIGYHNNDPGVLANIDNPIIVFANHTCYMRLIMHDFSSIQNVLPFKGVDNLNIYWLYFATKDKQQFIEYKGHWPDLMVKQTIVPPKNITNLFGSFIKKMMINIFFHDKQNKTLTELRDTLLPKLLSGEIDVSNVEIDELPEN